jgi:hypothetical protein
MADTDKGPDSLEGMAFQLLLQKVTNLERAMQGIPPLLKKIVDQLEAQTKQPDVEVATYAQLYPELPQDAGDENETPQPGETERPHVPRRRGVWQWFVKEG